MFSTRFRFRLPFTALRGAAMPRRLRARRAVLFAFAFVFLAQLGLNLAIDTVKPEWRDPEYGHRLNNLRELQTAHPHRPLMLVLGSSRVQMGFSPSHLALGNGPADPVVFNMSQAGCGPLHELLNLQRLLADGVKPDFLLVEVLSPVLAGDGPAEKLFITQRLSLADVRRLEPYCVDAVSLRQEWAKHRLLPWYSLRQYLISHWLSSWLPWQHRQDFLWKQLKPDGWMPYFYDELPAGKRETSTAEAKAQYAVYFSNFRLAPLPQRAYRDLIALCKEQNIRLAFFVMPEGPTFQSWYPPGSRATIDGYLASLTREHGVPVFDARGWLGDEMFADSHHLMRHGAEAFSERFGQECVRGWVRGK